MDATKRRSVTPSYKEILYATPSLSTHHPNHSTNQNGKGKYSLGKGGVGKAPLQQDNHMLEADKT